MSISWLHPLAYFAAGALLANATPHYVSGVLGRPFQSPFATPSGRGLSSSVVNVLWGSANLAVAYLLLCHVGDFDARRFADALPAGLGLLLGGVMTARIFGALHGGNTPAAAP